MVEDNQFRYVRWEQCTKRSQELLGITLDPIWKPDSSGVIREITQREEDVTDFNIDLLLKYVLQRTALADSPDKKCLGGTTDPVAVVAPLS